MNSDNSFDYSPHPDRRQDDEERGDTNARARDRVGRRMFAVVVLDDIVRRGSGDELLDHP